MCLIASRCGAEGEKGGGVEEEEAGVVIIHVAIAPAYFL